MNPESGQHRAPNEKPGFRVLRDQRSVASRIWNADSLLHRFSLDLAPHESCDSMSPDEFLYRGYRQGGSDFLSAVEGRFATAHWDPERCVIFLARDWLGETPFHLIATPRGFVVGNTLTSLRNTVTDWYSYRYTRAFPQAKCLEIDVSGIDECGVSDASRYIRDDLYYDFSKHIPESPTDAGVSLTASLSRFRQSLQRSTEQRLSGSGGTPVAVLLSGGLDSLSVAMVLRSLGAPVIAYTLSVEDGGDDVQQAEVFAKLLGLEHRIVRVHSEEVLRVAPQIVEIAETYHLYNYYCSVGMYFLGRRLASDGIRTAFCGEAVNEALGDYHSWELRDPTSGHVQVLQHVPYERMTHSTERLLYVWGQARDRGKYNHQLGTGLAKHAGSRMVKPFLYHGLTLESPYYDRDVLSVLISLDAAIIESAGGKPGLFQRAFSSDNERFGLTDQMIASCKKVRLQDASEGGRGGLTPLLLGAGFDQEWLVRTFNRCFGSNLDPALESRRMVRPT